MSDIGVFVPEEQEFLISIFYKVGVWMSYADDDEGDDEGASDAEEEKVLIQVLNTLSKKNKKSPFIAHLTAEAARHTTSHKRWAHESDTTIADAVKGGKMIKAQMSPEDLALYKSALKETAQAVATAFREGDQGEKNWGEKIQNTLFKLTNKSLHTEQSISPAEDNALTELFEALKSI